MPTSKISETGEQHVEIHRKLLLRRHLLRWASDGAAYVPFIGDGDIAAALYRDRRIFGADLDPDRVETARAALPRSAEVRVADCDEWPFADVDEPFAVADFDAYVRPYYGFAAFWRQVRKADRLVLIFTDGCRLRLMFGDHWLPDGSRRQIDDDLERWRTYRGYLSAHVWPWFEAQIAPWRILDRWRYLRGPMVYWGAAIER